jgi:capsular exopolysaccharide synthesis family protein
VVDLARDGLYAERLRELRTNLRFTALPDGGGQPRLLAVTSPSAQEGRTTTAIDLVAALAESGRSVVLVDGDLRHPACAGRLPLNDAMRSGAAQCGLSTVLVGEHDLFEGLITDIRVRDHPFSLLPAGPTAPRPGELWATDRAQTLFEDLAKAFDYVVVDTPPLGGYSDGAIIGALCDGAIVLARIKRTTTVALRRALQMLQVANVHILGTVVTFEPVGRLALRRYREQRGKVAEPAGRATGEDAGNGRRAHRRQDGRPDIKTGPIVDDRLVAPSSGEASRAQGESR